MSCHSQSTFFAWRPPALGLTSSDDAVCCRRALRWSPMLMETWPLFQSASARFSVGIRRSEALTVRVYAGPLPFLAFAPPCLTIFIGLCSSSRLAASCFARSLHGNVFIVCPTYASVTTVPVVFSGVADQVDKA